MKLPTTIPTDYAKALGGESELKFPPFLETTRIAIGPAFSGKTSTFVRQPHTGYLDAQGGAKFSPPGEGSMVFQCRNWPEVDTRLSRFITDARAGRCPFKHVVLDPFMRIRQWYEEFLDAQYAAETLKMKEGTPARDRRMGPDGKTPKAFKLAMGQKYEDWVNNNLMAMLNAARDAGLYWTVILHERTKEERKNVLDEYSPLIVTEGAAVGMNLFQKLCREADFFLDFESIQYGGDPAKTTVTTAPKKWQTAEMAAYEADRVIVRTRCTNRTGHITNYDRGVRIPLPETIELPRSCAYETLDAIYEQSKARELVFWASKKVGAITNPGVTAPTPETGVTPQEFVP